MESLSPASQEPEAAEAQCRLGRAQLAAGALDAAEETFRAAAALAPGQIEPVFGLSLVALTRDRPEEAEAPLRAVLARAPDYPEALFNLAYVLRRRGALAEALDCYVRAGRLAPDMPGLALSHASTEAAAGRPQAALERLRGALRHAPEAPEEAEICNQIGGTLLGLGAPEEALDWFRRALRRAPELAQARFGLAMALLTLGCFEAGWAAYESRWDDPAFRADEPERPAPLWRGEDPAGRTLLLHAEQGLGDTIQFLRYVPLLRTRGARIVLEVQRPLASLAAGLAEEVIVTGEAAPAHDWHCPLLSLPHRFATTLSTIPASVPYLCASAAARARWRDWLGPRHGPRIGIACSGSPGHPEDATRSIPAPLFLTAFAAIGAELVLVQADTRAEDAPSLAGVRQPLLADFAETAALMEELDLVVSVDTAPAHLAGALGRPVWVLLPVGADFRWLRERTDSPWYPSARLFRQTAWGEWGGALAAVNTALRQACTNARERIPR